MKTRRVTVDELLLRHPRFRGDDEVHEITLIARVSKGTYIRSLARDIARVLGTVGSVTLLRRTKAGPFILSQAISLDKLGELAKARRSEERRVGKESVSTCSTRWSTYHSTKNTTQYNNHSYTAPNNNSKHFTPKHTY